MKFCKHCGKELVDEAVVCTGCGCSTDDTDATNKASGKASGLSTAAKIFMIIGTVISGFAIFPLAWCLPMTLVYCSKIKHSKPVSLGFKVCSLLFVSQLGGILMLCDHNK